MRHKLVASAAYSFKSSGFSSSFLSLLTLNAAASGMMVFVTLLNEEAGENAMMPTKMKAFIKSSKIMDQTSEIIMSSHEIPNWSMTSKMKCSFITLRAWTNSW